ncbi:hypothetical protein M0811_05792 [Anaeramoeba ignava]|uniref:BTB domain-containing protein n=1 Tax=Anaeramoeba ignava TaxID=1746090 RepID=A0A9Q0LUI3_ANAIG|nr:hypothetical protein M0811_05792 [Anaeramoeba ignava]
MFEEDQENERDEIKYNEICFFGSNTFSFFPKSNNIAIPSLLHPTNQFPIKQISSGDVVAILLFENGEMKLHSNGLHDYQISKMKNIQKVSVSGNAAILTFDGNVFVEGRFLDSQFQMKFINISSLIEDKNDRIIKDVVCGRFSIYLLTSNHNVYGFGSNNYGQLGFDSFHQTDKPILMMKNVSKIFSGNSSNSVFLLNSNQELFGCGVNHFSQLGLENLFRQNQIKELTQIQNIPKGKIIDIQCGETHSIMLIVNDEKRKLYSCGNWQYNGLGKNKDTCIFTEIKSSLFENDNILDISCGKYHTLILTSNHNLIGFGANLFGQLGTEDTNIQTTPTQLKIPELSFSIFNYHVSCGDYSSFLYSPFLSNLEKDLIKLFERKEFYDISFKTINGEIIEAHKLILKYRLKDENQIEKLQQIISNKSTKESNQIFEMIYSNRIINRELYSEIKEIIQQEKIEETMKRIYLNENEKDFIIERKEKQYKFPKLILIMRSELYRGMFLSVTEDKSNKVTDYSELSNKSFQIFEYWIYLNQIKEEIQITQEIIEELEIGIDYFQLNQTNPNLFDLLKERI